MNGCARRTAALSGAVGSAFLASVCCVGPLVLALLGPSRLVAVGAALLAVGCSSGTEVGTDSDTDTGCTATVSGDIEVNLDAHGYVTRMSEACGDSVCEWLYTYQRDEMDRITRRDLTEPDGTRLDLEVTWGDEGWISEIASQYVDADGSSASDPTLTSFDCDENGRVLGSNTNGVADPATFEWDGNGRITSWSDHSTGGGDSYWDVSGGVTWTGDVGEFTVAADSLGYWEETAFQGSVALSDSDWVESVTWVDAEGETTGTAAYTWTPEGYLESATRNPYPPALPILPSNYYEITETDCGPGEIATGIAQAYPVGDGLVGGDPNRVCW